MIAEIAMASGVFPVAGAYALGRHNGRKLKPLKHGHVWGNWGESHMQQLRKNNGEHYSSAIQVRECLGCGFEEFRIVRSIN
jgi:hypothetical protein